MAHDGQHDVSPQGHPRAGGLPFPQVACPGDSPSPLDKHRKAPNPSPPPLGKHRKAPCLSRVISGQTRAPTPPPWSRPAGWGGGGPSRQHLEEEEEEEEGAQQRGD
ncbi:hypothetical protein ACOMHN_011863 [Nucella lapillus]